MSTSASERWTPFRKLEKHFKNRAVKGQLPSLRKYPIIDLSRPTLAEDDPLWKAGWWSPINDLEIDTCHARRNNKGKARDLGERPSEAAQQYGLRTLTLSTGETGYLISEGCILIPGYLDQQQQLKLLEDSLSRYTLPPNPLSLATHYDLPPNLFELYEARSPGLITPLFDTLSPTHQDIVRTITREREGPPTTNDPIQETQVPPDLHQILSRNKAWSGDMPALGLKAKIAEALFSELRWANLGLIYKWTTKAYDLDPSAAIPFPAGLAELCRGIASAVDWPKIFSEKDERELNVQTWPTDYVPDTGIVNFYGTKDTLMGHVDRSELDPFRPLVSLSLGHAAVFLLGSITRDIEPIPIILRSGDVIIMSGRGRQNYHGIPRILEGTLPDHFAKSDGDSVLLGAAKRWISTGRINVNARQVYPPHMKPSQNMHR